MQAPTDRTACVAAPQQQHQSPTPATRRSPQGAAPRHGEGGQSRRRTAAPRHTAGCGINNQQRVLHVGLGLPWSSDISQCAPRISLRLAYRNHIFLGTPRFFVIHKFSNNYLFCTPVFASLSFLYPVFESLFFLYPSCFSVEKLCSLMRS